MTQNLINYEFSERRTNQWQRVPNKNRRFKKSQVREVNEKPVFSFPIQNIYPVVQKHLSIVKANYGDHHRSILPLSLSCIDNSYNDCFAFGLFIRLSQFGLWFGMTYSPCWSNIKTMDLLVSFVRSVAFHEFSSIQSTVFLVVDACVCVKLVLTQCFQCLGVIICLLLHVNGDEASFINLCPYTQSIVSWVCGKGENRISFNLLKLDTGSVPIFICTDRVNNRGWYLSQTINEPLKCHLLSLFGLFTGNNTKYERNR